jgi:hypothetical protein
MTVSVSPLARAARSEEVGEKDLDKQAREVVEKF